MAFACMVMAGVSPGQDTESRPDRERDLTDLSLDALVDIEISSVSKHLERLRDAPAAIYAITDDDLRRSGAHSIAEALRLVPGMDVAHIDANKWAISSRGFNGRFANKMLVLLDGRSVYTPTFSGVYWDVQDTNLADVERIEVIRGPGATLWGANAVDGVVNVITKPASETQGFLWQAGGGTEERGFGTMRYGGKLGDDVAYRLFVKYFNRDGSVDSSGADAPDAWDIFRGGMRVDWKASPDDTLVFEADAYGGHEGQTSTLALPDVPFAQVLDERTFAKGHDILARWSHTASEAAGFDLQLYYDSAARRETVLAQTIDTFDLDFADRFELLGTRLQWGVGYRVITDDERGSYGVAFEPSSRTDQLASAFLEDTIPLVADRLKFTFGSKFEHNDYSGFEVQPSARLAWTPGEDHTVWAAISRAVRTPSRAEHDVRLNLQSFPSPPTGVGTAAILGDSSFVPETLLAYELGYRVRPADGLSFDLAAFYNVYDRLLTAEPATPFVEPLPAPPHLLVPRMFSNRMAGETYGFELSSDWRPFEAWRLSGSYSFLEMQLHAKSSNTDPTAEAPEQESPEQQFQIRSYLDLTDDLEFDVAGYWVDRTYAGAVPAYFRLDARIGWRPTQDIEVGIGAQNILDDRHPEIAPGVLVFPLETQRSFYAEVTIHF